MSQAVVTECWSREFMKDIPCELDVQTFQSISHL
jgi:hypothetical protein